MKKIGITQRVEFYSKINESRDCLDQRWHSFLKGIDLIGIALPNCPIIINQYLSNIELSGFLLTGGNDLSDLPDSRNYSEKRDKSEKEILEKAQITRLPVVGVCRGFQYMNVFLGGSLSKVRGHVAEKHQIILKKNFPLVSDIEIHVNSFHDWAIHENDLATDLIPLAVALDGTIEAAYHRSLRWLGIMWHPERSMTRIDKHLFDFVYSSNANASWFE